MKRMTSIIAMAAALALICAEASAIVAHTSSFDNDSYLAGDILRYAGNLHHYEALDTAVTDAPAGYKAFYLSHISRHGSRGHSKEENFRYLDTLYKFKAMGILTDDAQRLMDLLTDIRNRNYAEGLGLLTSLGAKEQSEIGRRAAEHYPEIFTDNARQNVICYHTVVPRVVSSMENFIAPIQSRYPGLKISKADNKSSAHARHEVKVKTYTAEQKEYLATVNMIPYRDSLLGSLDSARLLKKTFVGGRLPSYYRKPAMRFFYNIYSMGSCRQCFLTDTLGYVESYFTEDELAVFSEYRNASHMQRWGWTAENRGYRAHNAGRILRNIIKDADAVIAGADTCATLRFCHDSDVLPLLSLIGVKGADWHGSYRQMWGHCNVAYLMHMAGNLQFVFYRNNSGDVIVKIMLNEEETVIPTLAPDYKAVFYKWDRFKEYLRTLII